jgi:type I restriction enzyme M protein
MLAGTCNDFSNFKNHMPKSNGPPKPPRAIASTQSLSAFVKSICDIMRRSNCASALQYVPELTWILFLRILDAQETAEQEKAEAVGKAFTPALRAPYRWQDWAAPYNERDFEFTPEGQRAGWKRAKLEAGKIGDFFAFINKELLPYLHGLDMLPDGRANPSASPKQRIIGIRCDTDESTVWRQRRQGCAEELQL